MNQLQSFKPNNRCFFYRTGGGSREPDRDWENLEQGTDSRPPGARPAAMRVYEEPREGGRHGGAAPAAGDGGADVQMTDSDEEVESNVVAGSQAGGGSGATWGRPPKNRPPGLSRVVRTFGLVWRPKRFERRPMIRDDSCSRVWFLVHCLRCSTRGSCGTCLMSLCQSPPPLFPRSPCEQAFDMPILLLRFFARTKHYFKPAITSRHSLLQPPGNHYFKYPSAASARVPDWPRCRRCGRCAAWPGCCAWCALAWRAAAQPGRPVAAPTCTAQPPRVSRGRRRWMTSSSGDGADHRPAPLTSHPTPLPPRAATRSVNQKIEIQ